MDVSTIVNNKKPCPVCTYLKIYSEEFVLEVNTHIFSNSKYKEILELLEKSNVLNNKQKPSKHFVEKHKTDCLVNFEIPVEKLIVQNGVNKNLHLDILNVNTKIEEYIKQNLEDKQNYKLQLLDEIEFLVISTVHHELINGRLDKGFIPKDDISSLKIINDVMKGKSDSEQKENNINEYEKLSFDKLSKLEEILNEK
jgi:hypothetical protein